jgi:hypothetical protein
VCVSVLQSLVPSDIYKWLINPMSNSYPVYSHTPKYFTTNVCKSILFRRNILYLVEYVLKHFLLPFVFVTFPDNLLEKKQFYHLPFAFAICTCIIM